jgi:hypothetical protein
VDVSLVRLHWQCVHCRSTRIDPVVYEQPTKSVKIVPKRRLANSLSPAASGIARATWEQVASDDHRNGANLHRGGRQQPNDHLLGDDAIACGSKLR